MADSIDLESDFDQQTLENHGLNVDTIRRQLSLLKGPRRRVHLDRACTIDDGIIQLPVDVYEELIDVHRRSADAGRWSKFVPASGAATRMFALQTDGDRQKFCESFRQFAFFGSLQDALPQGQTLVDELLRTKQYDMLIDSVMSAEGLSYDETPKGLIAFHAYPDQTRTPFEEHLLESLTCLNASDGKVQAHFTISPSHRKLFADRLKRFAAEQSEANLEVNFSVQFPSTDTIAINDDGELLRDDNSQPVFRPGGHGALLTNLNDRQADLIFVKNIDNVSHEHSRKTTTDWIQILGGYLVQSEETIHEHLHALEANEAGAVQSALELVQTNFPGALLPTGDDSHQLRTALIEKLKRPLRVCGMVKNEGEPGGGPFWVRANDDSTTIQIVESAEVDKQDSEQEQIFGQGTHFNPVFMALAVRDNQSQPFDLHQFVDPARAIVTHKVVDGKKATVLEHPGLWNGAMANWNSLFVEVPRGVFTPVKSVFDLLRVEHQP